MPQEQSNEIKNLIQRVTKLEGDSIIHSLKNQIKSLKSDIEGLKSALSTSPNKQLKYEMGEFDIQDEDEWDEIDEADDGDTYDYKYTIPVKLHNFTKNPQVFLSITGLDEANGIWIYADNIKTDSFDIILESYYDLDEPINVWGYYRGLVISWLALGK